MSDLTNEQLDQARESQKRCGNCRHSRQSARRAAGFLCCIVPLPVWAKEATDGDDALVYETDGTRCPCHKPKEQGE